MREKGIGARIFQIVNVAVMLFLVFVTVFPFWSSIVGSLNEGLDYTRGGVYFWPRKFSLTSYKFLLQDEQIFRAMLVSVLRTVLGTASGLIVTACVSYAMIQKRLRGRSLYAVFMIFTMYFSGGVIPTYLLYQNLGLIDNFLVYILPSLFNVYYMIIIQASFREIPEAVPESARLDGAGEYRIFWSLYLPMSVPVIAAVSLFIAVGHWNSYFDSMMYTSEIELQTIQYYLQRMISQATQSMGVASRAQAAMPAERTTISAQTITLATMVFVTVPILVVYPFVQKYFVKGVMVGSVKG